MRLIKEDDVMRMLTDVELSRTIIPITEAKTRLRDIPTAYDVEKVVEELKMCLESEKVSFGYLLGIKDAIEIIRKGGIES